MKNTMINNLVKSMAAYGELMNRIYRWFVFSMQTEKAEEIRKSMEAYGKLLGGIYR